MEMSEVQIFQTDITNVNGLCTDRLDKKSHKRCHNEC